MAWETGLVHAVLKCTCNEKYIFKGWRLKRKKLAALHQVIFRVVFSLLLTFLGPLEGSAVEKCAESSMSLQYPHRVSWVRK